jgi:hypothetical protein
MLKKSMKINSNYNLKYIQYIFNRFLFSIFENETRMQSEMQIQTIVKRYAKKMLQRFKRIISYKFKIN